jgi:hypothetical protein
MREILYIFCRDYICTGGLKRPTRVVLYWRLETMAERHNYRIVQNRVVSTMIVSELQRAID